MEITTITMKQFLILTILFVIGCRGGSKNNLPDRTPIENRNSLLCYRLIKDNLYIDKNKNLYIKSIDNTSDENPKDVYISNIFIPEKDKKIPLNTIIDTVTYEQLRYSNYSKDKNNIYFLRKTLEGGYFNIIGSAKSGDFELITIDSVSYGKLGNVYFYNGEIVKYP